MSAFEMWTCDYHAAGGPESEHDVVNEDEARDKGWVRVERSVGTMLPSGRPYTVLEIAHVCDECVKDPECREWIESEGYTPYLDEDREALSAAAAHSSDSEGGA